MQLTSFFNSRSAKRTSPRLFAGITAALAAIVLMLGLQACGGGGGGGGGGRSGSNTPTVSLLAGSVGGTGSLDGTGTGASFLFKARRGNAPHANIASDSTGNQYVADTHSHTIRKITSGGVVTTLAGSAGVSGNADGTGSAARFSSPNSIAVDSAGNIYVSDTGNYLVRKITPAGVVSTLAGSGTAGNADGTGTAASFTLPSGLALDNLGNLYLTDSGSHTIRKITAAGVVSTFAGSAGTPGSADNTGILASFNTPQAVAIDNINNLYVTEQGNHTVRKITPAAVVTTYAGTAGTSGSTDGIGSGALFNTPTGIAIDSSGRLYVADSANNTIRVISASAGVTTFAGTVGSSGYIDTNGTAAKFSFPFGLTLDPSSGNLFATDGVSLIRKITPSADVTTFAGSAPISGSTDGTGSAARFNEPLQLSADSAGNVYAADSSSNTIRKITSSGVVSTFAGIAGTNGSTDNPAFTATFNTPYGTAADVAGNVYVADQGNALVRKIDTAGMVTTLSNAGMSNVSAVAVDTVGNVYVADRNGQAVHKITTAGVVSVFATGVDSPVGITVDTAGTVYVTNINNHTISKITTLGVVSTLAGTGTSGSTDNTVGTLASFNNPYGITIDGTGNLYVADKNNHTIRKITSTGTVTTVLGVAGQQGFASGAVLPNYLRSPQGVAVSGGKLYITTSYGIVVTSSLP